MVPRRCALLKGFLRGSGSGRREVDADLARRRKGYGRGGRMSIESDRCRILSGVRHGVSLGSPICLLIENLDHANWVDRMSPERPAGSPSGATSAVTLPRPGHADLVGVWESMGLMTFEMCWRGQAHARR